MTAKQRDEFLAPVPEALHHRVRLTAGGRAFDFSTVIHDETAYMVAENPDCRGAVFLYSAPDGVRRHFHSHPDLSPLFDQIYRDAKGDLYLTPKLGNHLVQVGNVERLDDKFHNLIAFYTRGLPQVGWDKYSQVSVKYRGQVVCTKRKTS